MSLKKYYQSYQPGKDNPYVEEKLIAYRNLRPAKTTGNPYYYLDEPIGDLRDNMGCQNIDLSNDIIVKEAKIKYTRFRYYYSQNAKHDLPAIFFIHGGGFIGGSIDVVENPCKRLAMLADAIVFNIDYRLAPEFKYPMQINECLQVINGIYNDKSYHFNRQQIFIAGDSAGGNLALACLQQDYINTTKKRFLGAILYYPVVDLSQSLAFDKTKYRGYHNDLVLAMSQSLLGSEKLMNKLYLQNETTSNNSLVSPLYMKDFSIINHLMVIYAEYDYLRIQIEEFIKLASEKIDVTSYCFQGVNHAFLDLLGIIDQSDLSLHLVANYIKKLINSSN